MNHKRNPKDEVSDSQANVIDWTFIALFLWVFAWGTGRDVAEYIERGQIAKLEQALDSK